MSVLGVFMCLLTVFMSRNRMLLSFFVLSHFVMMNSFTVVMCGCLVMPGCIVVVLTGGMFHGHSIRPFKKSVLTTEGHPVRKTSRKRWLSVSTRRSRLGRTVLKVAMTFSDNPE